MIIKTTFHIDSILYKRLKKYCIDHDLKIKNVITEAIDEWLYEKVKK